MKRSLPPWMTSKGLELKQETFPELTLPLDYKVIYSHDVNDCSILCSEFLASLEKLPVAVGFDTEWTPSFKAMENKVAVVQICTSVPKQIFVFHIAKMGCLPTQLQKFIENTDIIKTGVNVSGDLWKLNRNFDVDWRSTQSSYTDLSKLAQSGLLNGLSEWSLTALVKHVLKKHLGKEKSTRLSNWENFPLTNCQITYAALDAYASLKVYENLQHIKKP